MNHDELIKYLNERNKVVSFFKEDKDETPEHIFLKFRLIQHFGTTNYPEVLDIVKQRDFASFCDIYILQMGE